MFNIRYYLPLSVKFLTNIMIDMETKIELSCSKLLQITSCGSIYTCYFCKQVLFLLPHKLQILGPRSWGFNPRIPSIEVLSPWIDLPRPTSRVSALGFHVLGPRSRGPKIMGPHFILFLCFILMTIAKMRMKDNFCYY